MSDYSTLLIVSNEPNPSMSNSEVVRAGLSAQITLSICTPMINY